ncbi:MAG TPA: CHAP domain-containing protein [Candidatus Sulfotelmatobacter sp.]|nr:CHAP domain-containing protein [Candidatus Sulfotelmatobacter sp.]
MRIAPKLLLVALFCGLGLCSSWGQQRQADDDGPLQEVAEASNRRESDRTLNQDDRLSVIAAALDPKVRRHASPDCSHLVHAIYEKAGFPYTYANSKDLYSGVEGFQRVNEPEPGDLVVWRGHVGIVVRPSRHVFFSFMSRGPGVDDYESRYWKHRGHARFYRYIKDDPCPGCPLRVNAFK